MSIELWKTILPIITFILGVACTWFIKEREKKNTKIENAVKEISQLSMDWYSQLYEIKQKFISKESEGELRKALIYHSQSRSILPKLLQNMEIISGNKLCNDLCRSVNALLQIVTVSSTEKIAGARKETICKPTLNTFQKIPMHLCNTELSSLFIANNFPPDPTGIYEMFPEVKLLVALVDEKMQEINKLSGIVLKKL